MKDERVKEFADWICISPYRHQSATEAIRTAYAEGMLRAAEVCEGKRGEEMGYEGDRGYYNMAVERCAAAIRAEAE